MPVSLAVQVERWPVAGAFTISRGSRTEAVTVTALLDDGSFHARGECVPYARYGETVEGVVAAIESMAPSLAAGLSRQDLQQAMKPGAARNALDCALWDMDAKRQRRPVHTLAGLSEPKPLITAFTISLASAEEMARAAAEASSRKLLKIKLGATGDILRIRAVREAAPDCELIVDANEGWGPETLRDNLAACADAGVTLIEQPLPAAADDMLAAIPHPVTICADESLHDRASLAGLANKYDAINIKLDKTGGLTEALLLIDEAERLGLTVMAGCMLSTSLSMAPAMLVAQRARLVDLDGPLLLAKDRANGLRYADSLVYPPTPALWG